MNKLIPVFIVVALAVTTLAWAAGGKMRLSEVQENIEESFLLCQQSGVRQITLTQEDLKIVMECEPQRSE
ncbi:MAG: hypothetical protein MUF57_01180 [Gammaproteobacteria bacterium]|jgi:anti-anti-sigma regulatory factor|nr:hypothetical protein [Gammaproteobacteria bacterium]